MCLIAFDYRPHDDIPLRLVANRDELHARPTAPLACWKDKPDILGGRDLEAGGTWLAVHHLGRFAAVTTVRDPRLAVPPGAPSRGHLVPDALEADDLPAWLAWMAEDRALSYAGFNLLAGDGVNLWHLHRGLDGISLTRVTPGLHALSNAGLDTPWPKTIAASQGLAGCLRQGHWPRDALAVMADTRPADDHQLPDTGVGLDKERWLSPAFILGQDYGTRAISWLTWHADGRIELGERRFGPAGVMLGETVERLAPSARH